MTADKSDITKRLRQTRADMLGTDDEPHYWDCHEAAGEIERLRDRLASIATGDNDRPEAIAADCPVQDNAPKQDTTPEWMARPFWVDPPAGHRYGFPKLYDPASDGDMTTWMVANGYPQHLADKGLNCTFTATESA